MFNRIRVALNRPDPTYDRWAAWHQPGTTAERWKIIGLHLLPGVFGWFAVQYLVPFLEPRSGLSYAWLQFLTLGSMALGWGSRCRSFGSAEGLSFRQSLEYLGLTKFDLPGMVVVAPLGVIALGIIGFPYLAYGYEPVRLWLDRWSVIHMPEWHILYYGYYNFPLVPLLFIFVGNFLGEEVYFRGFLLKRLGFLGSRAWLVSNALFCAYHLWQAPTNWAYLPVFFLIPFAQVMTWRKSLWVTIVAHVLINFDLTDWVVSSLRGLL